MAEFRYQKLLSAMQDVGLDSFLLHQDVSATDVFTIDWYGNRPIVIKVPVAWKTEEDSNRVLVQYQAECMHGVRGQRPFEKWDDLSEDKKKQTVPRCDRCIADLETREAREEQQKALEQRLAIRRDRILGIRRFLRKEWKWILGFVVAVAGVMLAYCRDVQGV